DGEDYVHRIGRTGRAGSKGKAITFVAGRELYKMQNIIRFTKGKVRRERVPTLEQVEARRTDKFFDTLRGTLELREFKNYDHFTDRLLEQGYAPTDIISALIHLREKENPKSGGEEISIPSTPEGKGKGKDRSEGRGEGKKAAKRASNDANMRTVVLNVGRSHRIKAGDVLGVILGATKVPKTAVGYIELHPRKTTIAIAEEHVE